MTKKINFEVNFFKESMHSENSELQIFIRKFFKTKRNKEILLFSKRIERQIFLKVHIF